VDLMTSMLEKDPGKRMSLDDVRMHPWLCEGLRMRAVQPQLPDAHALSCAQALRDRRRLTGAQR
jgi:hypothetical protein